MDKSEQAKSYFFSGHNCAQSVLLSFASELHYSTELAEKIAAGFGAGMGRTQQTCGAVTGAIMVMGIMQGERVNNNEQLKSESYRSAKELMEAFTEEFGTTRCSELIGCDLNTPEGSARFTEENMMENVCAVCVRKAVQIVETLTH
ncbi:MAG: C-GCAxxG-C-C family protein [Bacteroidales bacterium]